MTTEEEKYYEAYFDMFSTEGWKSFMLDLQGVHDGYVIENIKDVEELYRVQGERNVLQRILGFQHGIEAAYASIKEDGQSGDD